MATNQQLLTEAQNAKHKLMTGGTVAKVTKDGMTVEYTRASIEKLDSYIESLTISAGVNSRRQRPAGFTG